MSLVYQLSMTQLKTSPYVTYFFCSEKFRCYLKGLPGHTLQISNFYFQTPMQQELYFPPIYLCPPGDKIYTRLDRRLRHL